MPFHENEVQVAYAMMNVLGRQAPLIDPRLTRFCCCWMAFNNIYVRLAERNGNRAKLRLTKSVPHVPVWKQIGQFIVPSVTAPVEFDMIRDAVLSLPAPIRDELLCAQATVNFVRRTPHQNRRPVEYGPFHQRLNGVLNVGYTNAVGFPIWAPIDPDQYQRYRAAPTDALRDELSTQLARVLYTVRNNTFHGGKEPEDENALNVLGDAMLILERIVHELLTV